MDKFSMEIQVTCIRQMEVCNLLYWPGPDIELEKQVPQWYCPGLGLITASISDPLPWGHLSTDLILCVHVSAFNFILLFSFQYLCFSLPWTHMLQIFFPGCVFTFLQDPAFFTSLHPRCGISPSSLTLPSDTPVSLLSPLDGELHCHQALVRHGCNCLLLMSAPPHHLEKGKSIKEMEKCISFLFYSALRKLGWINYICSKPQFLIDFTLKLSN